MTLTLRSCTSKDEQKVCAVLLGCGLARTEKNALEIFEREMKRGDYYIIAEDDEIPLGIVSWKRMGEIRHGLVELYHIGVVPEAVGSDVAKALFDRLISDCKKYYEEKNGKLRKLYLLTHEDNDRARAFYEKVGMKHETNLKDHMRENLNECVYSVFFD